MPAYLRKQQRRQHQKSLLHKFGKTKAMHKFGQTKFILESPPPQTAEEQDENSDTESSSSTVLTSLWRSRQSCAPTTNCPSCRHVEVAATAVDEDTDAAPPTGCQSEAASQAPSAYPLYQRGASPLHEGGNAELQASRLREKLRIITTTRRKSCLAST